MWCGSFICNFSVEILFLNMPLISYGGSICHLYLVSFTPRLPDHSTSTIPLRGSRSRSGCRWIRPTPPCHLHAFRSRRSDAVVRGVPQWPEWRSIRWYHITYVRHTCPTRSTNGSVRTYNITVCRLCCLHTLKISSPSILHSELLLPLFYNAAICTTVILPKSQVSFRWIWWNLRCQLLLSTDLLLFYVMCCDYCYCWLLSLLLLLWFSVVFICSDFLLQHEVDWMLVSLDSDT